MGKLRAPLLGIVALALVALASPARADDAPAPATRHEPTASDLATARTALKEGLALREKGDLEAAFMRFSTAYDIVQTPVTAFELGKTHMMLGRILQARELFVKIGRMPKAMEESDRSAASRDEAARLAKSLEPRIPTLRIHLKLPPGAACTLRVDDEIVPAAGETTPRAVDPGRHEIAAKAGDGPEQKVSIEIGESEIKDVELSPQWIPPKVKPAGPGSQVVLVRQTNPLVFIGFGVASASLVTTAVFTVLAVEATNKAEDRCGHDFCSEKVRNQEVSQAGAFTLAALIAAGATIGFTVMGAVSISNPVKEKYTTSVKPVVGPTGAGVVGTF
jgi:hypothetical protein